MSGDKEGRDQGRPHLQKGDHTDGCGPGCPRPQKGRHRAEAKGPPSPIDRAIQTGGDTQGRDQGCPCSQKGRHYKVTAHKGVTIDTRATQQGEQHNGATETVLPYGCFTTLYLRAKVCECPCVPAHLKRLSVTTNLRARGEADTSCSRCSMSLWRYTCTSRPAPSTHPHARHPRNQNASTCAPSRFCRARTVVVKAPARTKGESVRTVEVCLPTVSQSPLLSHSTPTHPPTHTHSLTQSHSQPNLRSVNRVLGTHAPLPTPP